MSDSFEPDLRQGLRAHATRVARPHDPAADVRRRLRRQDTVQRSLAAVGVLAVLALVGVASIPLLGNGGIVLDSSPPASEPGVSSEPGESSGADESGHGSDKPADESAGDVSGDSDDEEAEACSAAELDAELAPQPDLPDAVAETRERLAAAAVRCDFEGLGELAGDDFTFSFGGGEDPAEFWRRAEDSGDEPLRALVEVLWMPHAVGDGGDADILVWPAAFARDTWEDVSAEEREALRALYNSGDLDQFAQFGSYIGYRVGIRGDGAWLFFVAGD